MEGESGFTRSMIYELPASDIQRDQMDGEGGASGSIIEELQSSEVVE